MSGRRVDSETYAPAADLADVIDVHWSTAWDLRGQPPHTALLLSDPSINFAIETTGGPHGSHRLVGVWTRLWRRTLEGRGRVRAVKLRPGALRAFVDAPAAAFTNRIVPLTAIFARGVPALRRVVLAPDIDDAGVAAFEPWLRARRRPADPDVALAVAIAARIAADRDLTTVARLAAASGLGQRALERLFRLHVGVPPKWVIRRHRLQEIAVRLERGDPASLAAMAADLGYTDQAHLTRDFRSAVGKSPREFAVSVHR